jgi:hypothetical protein
MQEKEYSPKHSPSECTVIIQQLDQFFDHSQPNQSRHDKQRFLGVLQSLLRQKTVALLPD